MKTLFRAFLFSLVILFVSCVETNDSPFETGNRPTDPTQLYATNNSGLLAVTADEELQTVSIYNLRGQCVRQATTTEINISDLPEGLYILQAQTTDGDLLQGKFIHRR